MTRKSKQRYNAREAELARANRLTIREYRARARLLGRIQVRPPPSPVPRAVARAAINLRSAGMPKDEVYRALRPFLAHPPTKRQLDQIYLASGAGYRRGPGGQRGVQYTGKGNGTRYVPSRYREDKRAEQKVSYLGMGRRNKQYAAAYLRSQGLDPKTEASEAYIDWVEGTAEGTP